MLETINEIEDGTDNSGQNMSSECLIYSAVLVGTNSRTNPKLKV